MAVCWLSARTCNLFPSSFVGARHVVPVRDPFVEAGRNSSRPGREPGSSFSLATRHCFLARHSPLLFTVDGWPSGRRLAARHPMARC